jgi:hypothetical protein
MEKMRRFASVLIVGTLIVFVGCKKTEDVEQENPAVEAQPALHAEPEDRQQEAAVPAVESTAPTEHEVVAITREFLKAIEGGDYDRAIGLGTPGEFKREGLTKFNELCQLDQAKVIKAYVGNEQAAVLTNTVPAEAPARSGQFGYSLLRNGNRWLIRDSDFLPTNESVEKWLTGFKGVEPNAQRVLGED